MLLCAKNFSTVFWAAVVPEVAAVALLALGLREPAHPQAGKRANPICCENLRRLSTRCWWVVEALHSQSYAREKSAAFFKPEFGTHTRLCGVGEPLQIRPPMKLQTFILFISFIFFGFIVPLWGASSQGSSTASPSPSPTPISTLEASKIDPLVRVRQMVENDPRNARTSLRKRYRPTRSTPFFTRGK